MCFRVRKLQGNLSLHPEDKPISMLFINSYSLFSVKGLLKKNHKKQITSRKYRFNKECRYPIVLYTDLIQLSL